MTGPVLVIGGTRGTGLLIARRLHARGHTVRVLARDLLSAAARLGPEIEVVPGDLTRPGTLTSAVRGAAHIVFTAGVRSGRYAPESLVRATDHDGVLATLAAAKAAGLGGRFVYLNSQGVTRPSLSGLLLNLLKRNTLVWRRRVEDGIRASGADYAIIRVPFLTDGPGGVEAIDVSQGALPLSPWRHITRTDAAEVFVAAMEHPAASRVTFEIAAGKGRPADVGDLLRRLRADTPPQR